MRTSLTPSSPSSRACSARLPLQSSFRFRPRSSGATGPRAQSSTWRFSMPSERAR
jgi:hypothetical protein